MNRILQQIKALLARAGAGASLWWGRVKPRAALWLGGLASRLSKRLQRWRRAAARLYRRVLYPRRLLLGLVGVLAVAAVLTALGMAARPAAQDVPQEGVQPGVQDGLTLPQDTATDTDSATSTDVPASDTDTPDASDTDLPPHDTAYHFDADGMLLYDTYGHYVQAQSYGAGGDIPWTLRLVNDWNPMPAGYDDGLTLRTIGGQTVDERMADALERMLADGGEHGLALVSGFRAASLQRTLYWNKVTYYLNQGYNDLDAQLLGGTVVKRPGFSEHNTGLAADLGGSGNFSLEADFADTEAYAWLIDHCADYGFILRFPEGKEDVTGVIYEPWHYRYVGVDAAREIMSQGLCLEEYLQQTGQ